jgi:hypothetical protein
LGESRLDGRILRAATRALLDAPSSPRPIQLSARAMTLRLYAKPYLRHKYSFVFCNSGM